VPTARLAFSDRRMVRVVEPGDVEVWFGAHSAASRRATSTGDSTGGAITNVRATGTTELPGAATDRHRLTVTGDVHEVTPADARLVSVRVVG
jgi:hypothetical protein